MTLELMKQSGKSQPASPKNLPLAKKSCLGQVGKGGHGRQVRIQEKRTWLVSQGRIMCSTKHEKGKTVEYKVAIKWEKS